MPVESRQPTSGLASDDPRITATQGPYPLPSAIGPGSQAGLGCLAMVIGLVLLSSNESIAQVLAQGLPWRAEVASAGTNVPSFADVAPTILWRSGIVMLIFGILLLLGLVVSVPEWLRRKNVGRITALLVVVGTGVWYGWLSYPHNAFPSNARFHWVDYLTYDSDNFFYAAGRLPHMLFYEIPHVWQGLNASVVAGLCYIIARQLRLSQWNSAAIACVPAVSGNMLLFANTAEDVMINLALLLGVVSALLSRRAILVGVVLALAVVGRPSFIAFIPCLMLAEAIRSFRATTSLRDVEWRFLSIAGVAFIVLTLAAQTMFTALGDRYFFVDGRVVDTGIWDNQIPLEVDGFTIFPFSGTYFLHLLWVTPFVSLAAGVIALFVARGRTIAVQTTVYTCGLAVVTHLLIHEAKPTFYYNVRYLTYALPFILFLGWAAVSDRRVPRRGGVQAALVALLVLGMFVFPARAIELKGRVEARIDHELLAVKDELRAIVGDRRVLLDYGDRDSRNYVAYVLRGNINSIRLLKDSALEPRDVVISKVEDPWSTAEPVIETDSFLVFDP